MYNLFGIIFVFVLCVADLLIVVVVVLIYLVCYIFCSFSFVSFHLKSLWTQKVGGGGVGEEKENGP